MVGDESAVRVHIHTLDPDGVVRFVGARGTLQNISIRDMDEQHEDYLVMQKKKAVDIAVVAVVAGDGLAGCFH